MRYEGDVAILSQEKAIEKLDRDAMSNKGARTPMDSGYVNADRGKMTKFENVTTYRSKIGSLMFIACNTRPDIAQAVCYLSRFNHQPTTADHRAVNRVINYLWETKTKGIRLECDREQCIEIYCDSSYGDCRESGKSTYGYIIFVGGAAVSWTSKRTKMVCTSTLEAELEATVQGLKEGLYVWGVIGVLTGARVSVTLYNDNLGLVKAVNEGKVIERTRPFRVKYYYLREELIKHGIKFEHVSSEDNIADGLTKPLGPTLFMRNREMMKVG